MLGSGQSLAFESVTPFWPVAVAPYQTADYNRSCRPIQAPLAGQPAFSCGMAMRTATRLRKRPPPRAVQKPMMAGTGQKQLRELLPTFGERLNVVQRKTAATFAAEKLTKLAVAFARELPPSGRVIQSMCHRLSRRKYCISSRWRDSDAQMQTALEPVGGLLGA